ncbi:DapH/DapD/GlmU-related protein [Curtobacterium sp. DN_7.5]|uniref:acyltransferase n=1 Tax=Curtobacterium sp. DN_7.5 TaxID=3049047 RepID=UPI001F57B2B5|nr:DapH/DapD/GlmU-related protein [Curtobacterium sp. DN_7.5]
MTHSPSSPTARLREDLTYGTEHVLFSTLLGSALIPRVVRRALLNLAGAHVGSGPGVGFALTGSARNLTIGTGVFCNKHVSIEAVAPVTIGDDTAIGMQVLIVTSHHGIDATGDWDRTASGRGVAIGERVWIGARTMVLPGAVVEDDVVVAAGAVVAGRLRSGGLYAGVPARRIRDLRPTESGGVTDVAATAAVAVGSGAGVPGPDGAPLDAAAQNGSVGNPGSVGS